MTIDIKYARPRGHRVLLWAIVAALTCGGGYMAIAGSKSDAEKNPSVTVKVDAAPLPSSNDNQYSLAPVVKRVTPSVVKIVTRDNGKEIEGTEGGQLDDPILRQFFGPMFPQGRGRRAFRTPPQEGLGSGVIVSPDGYILTNNHVVANADKVTVTLNDGRDLTAKVVGKDDKTDIAVIKVDATDLPAVTFANSENVQVGDRVLAVGNPFGIGQTVTTGIVSATGRAAGIGLDYEDFIQTDAAINPGNSGGALIDMQGRLIGINTAILSRSGGFQGIGFAIPSDLARYVMNSLVETGKVTRGFLGINIQDLTPTLAEKFGLKNSTKGVLVGEVNNGSPAAKAGVKSGDIILSVDGKAVTDGQHLRFLVAETQPGTDVKLQLLRDGKEQTVEAKVGELPGDKELASNGKNSGGDNGVLDGVGVADLSPAIRREYEVPSRVEGAVVTEVDPDSASAAAGLAPGDVILEINRKQVNSADDAVKLTEKTENPKTLLKIWSRGFVRFVVVDETPEASH